MVNFFDHFVHLLVVEGVSLGAEEPPKFVYLNLARVHRVKTLHGLDQLVDSVGIGQLTVHYCFEVFLMDHSGGSLVELFDPLLDLRVRWVRFQPPEAGLELCDLDLLVVLLIEDGKNSVDSFQ